MRCEPASSLAATHPIEGNEINVGSSIGISIYPDDGQDAGALLKAADTASVAAYVPVLIACGLAGLVLALLTVATVISGAVAAGSTRIRVLKIIGFSPGQVAAAYAGQGLVPAAAGCLGGVLLGNVLARPLLAGAAYVFGPGVLGVPAWVDVDVTVVMFGLTTLAALVPARRLSRVP